MARHGTDTTSIADTCMPASARHSVAWPSQGMSHHGIQVFRQCAGHPQPLCCAIAALQTECAATFADAQTFFKVAPGQIPPPGAVTPAQIQAFLAQAKPPSPG
jgi:hypothetical protein